MMLGTSDYEEFALHGVLLNELGYHARQCTSAVEKLKLLGFSLSYLNENWGPVGVGVVRVKIAVDV